MANWKATVQLDGKILTMYTECEYYGTAYVNILAKLPSRCSRGDCQDGIIDLVKCDEMPPESQNIDTRSQNGQIGLKKSVKINILEPEDCV